MPPFCFLPIDVVIAVEIRAFASCIPIAPASVDQTFFVATWWASIVAFPCRPSSALRPTATANRINSAQSVWFLEYNTLAGSAARNRGRRSIYPRTALHTGRKPRTPRQDRWSGRWRPALKCCNPSVSWWPFRAIVECPLCDRGGIPSGPAWDQHPSSLMACDQGDVRPRYAATSNPAAGCRMPFSRPSGNEETRNERPLPDRPRYNI